MIFKKAYNLYKKHGCKAKVVGHQLTDSKPYLLTATQSPAYFQEVVNLSGRYDFKQGYYTYRGTGSYDVYVDFAANHLGGGALDEGFVQEEIMFATMPNAAEHLLSTSPKPTIRYGGRNVSSPCGGSPNPYLMEGAVRTITVDLYGGSVLRGEKAHRDGTRNGKMITKENVGNYVHEVDPPNQGINILAIAAPRLHRNTDSKTLECVKDLFNTAYAGFALAKQHIPTEQQCMIHSGKLGCGAFNNNVKVSILAQLFAAQLHGIDITFYDFNGPEIQEMIDLYESITFPPNCTIEQGLYLIHQAVNK